MKKHIANGFTLLNLFFGCVSIIIIMYDSVSAHPLKNETTRAFHELSRQLTSASFLIIAAAIVDFFDGFVARMLGIVSGMGKQLDSLADVVSFGVAPALIVYRYLNYIYLNNGIDQLNAFLYALPCFIIALAGAYRLARFNINTKKTVHFQGVPIPVAALLTISIPFLATKENYIWLENLLRQQWFWYIYILFISYLMVSSLPILSLKSKEFYLNKDWWKLLIAIIGIVLGICIQWMAVPITFLIYIVFSVIFLPKET